MKKFSMAETTPADISSMAPAQTSRQPHPVSPCGVCGTHGCSVFTFLPDWPIILPTVIQQEHKSTAKNNRKISGLISLLLFLIETCQLPRGK
jgi:hypothetical protein